MSEMIERMANALCEQMPSLGSPSAPMVMHLARAAIAAMREPTDKMIHAGWINGNNGYGEGEEMQPIWEAMIDEALK